MFSFLLRLQIRTTVKMRIRGLKSSDAGQDSFLAFPLTSEPNVKESRLSLMEVAFLSYLLLRENFVAGEEGRVCML